MKQPKPSSGEKPGRRWKIAEGGASGSTTQPGIYTNEPLVIPDDTPENPDAATWGAMPLGDPLPLPRQGVPRSEQILAIFKDVDIEPFKEYLRNKLEREAEEREAERIGDPKDHPWYIFVKGLRLGGNGSDIDEIYGRISVEAGDGSGWFKTNQGKYTEALLDTGRGSIDLSKKDYVQLGNCMFECPSDWSGNQSAFVEFNFWLFDEDSGRDYGRGHGDRDDMFRIGRADWEPVERDFHKFVRTPTFDYKDFPEFRREIRQNVSLAVDGDFLTFQYQIIWFRLLDFRLP